MRTHSQVTRARVGAVLGVAVLATVGVVWASAPLDQYQQFGPKDDEIWDVNTGLHWERTLSSGPMAHSAASAHCLKGNGWRLPTIKELQTIVDEETYTVFEGGVPVTRALDRNAFPHAPVGAYWSSTLDVMGANKAWVVDFATGEAKTQAAGTPAYARCVRP